MRHSYQSRPSRGLEITSLPSRSQRQRPNLSLGKFKFFTTQPGFFSFLVYVLIIVFSLIFYILFANFYRPEEKSDRRDGSLPAMLNFWVQAVKELHLPFILVWKWVNLYFILEKFCYNLALLRLADSLKNILKFVLSLPLPKSNTAMRTSFLKSSV